MAAVAESSKEQDPCSSSSSSEALQEPKELTFKSLVSNTLCDLCGTNVFAKERDPGALTVSASLVGCRV